MKKSVSYRILVRFTALLLLAGIALPAGLQAKALIDFCLTSVEQNSDMLPDHSCCPLEADDERPASEDATLHDCEWGLICTCHIDRAPLSDQNWVATSTIFATSPDAVVSVITEDHTDRFYQPEISSGTYSTPPIFLLNSTFLN